MTSMAVVPAERLIELELEAWKEAGYTVVVDGDVIPDPLALNEAIYARMMTTLARSKQEVPDKAVGKANLAAEMFPAFPAPGSAGWDSSDPELVAVWGKLTNAINTRVGSGRRGIIQKMLGERDESKGLLLCNTTLDPSRTPAIYVTDVPALIEADFATARTDKVQNVAVEQAKDLAMAIERVPSMKRKLSRNWTKALDDAGIKSKTVLQLTAGPEDEA